MHGSHTSLSPERKISRIEIHSEGKVGFRFPTIPFLYHEYKIRNISIFYSLEFYFSQRAGEGRYIFIYLSPKLY